MRNSGGAAAAVNEWLAGEQRALIEDLAATLDLEAGLHDATLPAQHAQLVESLSCVLDVESGLAAILSADLDASLPNVREMAVLHDHLLDWASNTRDRLEFRSHTSAPARKDAPQCDCFKARKLVLIVTLHQAEAIRRGLGGSDAAAMSHAADLIATSRQALDGFDRPFDLDLIDLRRSVREIVTLLDRQGVLNESYDLAKSLVTDLDELDRILNDFSGEDLTGIPLKGIRLAGLRWSNDTRWPADWADLIRRNSVQLEPGVFVVRRDGYFS